MVRLPSIEGELDTCEITQQGVPRLSRLWKEANRPGILRELDTTGFVNHSGVQCFGLVSGFLTGLLTPFNLWFCTSSIPRSTESNPSFEKRQELAALLAKLKFILKRKKDRTISASELFILQPLCPHHLSVGRCRRSAAPCRASVQWMHRYGSKLGLWLGRYRNLGLWLHMQSNERRQWQGYWWALTWNWQDINPLGCRQLMSIW